MKYFKKWTSILAGMLCCLVISSQIQGVEVPGNKESYYPIPKEAQAVDVSKPDQIIGTGTPESCTADAFIKAVAKGGKIVFNGGDKPFTITLDKPAKLFNNANPDVVIDGGGLVTLSGGGKTRILYMNTADPKQVWTTDHAQNQDHPRLTVQNITFANGNSKNETEYDGGGAIWVRGGRFKVVNCRFINNVCGSKGPDIGGGAIRVFDQYEDLPVYVVNSTFGGAKGLGNSGANGGAISSIGVSWSIYNCIFSYNQALGNGGNPAQSGTPGGGSGGAIYNDGNEMTLAIYGSRIENNQVNAYGGGIFFVTNNHTGNILLDNTVVANNPGGSWYPVMEGVSMHSDTPLKVTQTVIKVVPTKTSQAVTLTLGGQKVTLDAYNFNDNNYFKLRDLAHLLQGTNKPFSVGWDGKNQMITVDSGRNYTVIGGEGSISAIRKPLTYEQTQVKCQMNGQSTTLTGYRINDNFYFKLRDLAPYIGIQVQWDQSTQTIQLNADATI